MIQFIEANGVFINLGLVVDAEVVEKADKSGEHELVLTNIAGGQTSYDGDTAEAITQRLTLLALQTDGAAKQLTIAAAQIEQQAAAMGGKQ